MAIVKLKQAYERIKGNGISKGVLTWYVRTGKIPNSYYKKEDGNQRGDYLIDTDEMLKTLKIVN